MCVSTRTTPWRVRVHVLVCMCTTMCLRTVCVRVQVLKYVNILCLPLRFYIVLFIAAR